MSELSASQCGCGGSSEGGCGSILWILILLLCCNKNDGCGCGGSSFFPSRSGGGCENIIWIILLLCCCGNNGF